MTPRSRLAALPFAAVVALSAHASFAQASLFYDDAHDDRAQPLAQTPPPSSPAASSADEPTPLFPRFGETGELVVNGGISLGGQKNWYSGDDASYSTLGVDVGVDYFVFHGLSIGAEVALSTSDQKGYEAPSNTLVDDSYSQLGAGFRIGYAIPLGDRWSLWPRAELFYEHNAATITSAGAPDVSKGVSELVASGYLPLVYTPVPHLFFGFGPSVNVPFGGSQEDSARYYAPWSAGAGFVLGGYFGGDAPRDAPPGDVAAPAKNVARFGDDGTFVLANDIVASGYHYDDGAYPSSSTTFSLQPAFDYFVARDISIGVAPSFSTSSSSTTDGNGASTTESSTSFALGARVGVNLPLGDVASLWLRGTLGFSVTSSSVTSSTSGPLPTVDSDAAYVSLSAPLLFHVVPHAFVGFGPNLYRELSRSQDQQGYIEPEATILGASAIIGGWL